MIDPGWFGLIFAQLVVYPQLYKTLKTKDVSGVATLTYIFLCVAVALYSIHAFLIRDTIFLISNTISTITNGVMLGLIIKYRK